jgi:hypothetical protein
LKFRLENIKSVGALKEAIKTQTKVEPNKQKLIHKGVELQVSWRVSLKVKVSF